MTRIPVALIRHAPTPWNEARRLQGRTDVPLSERGREAAGRWTLPADYRAFEWVASPLIRARQTAALLGLSPPAEPAIVEMDWGDWEGFTGVELREKYGEEFDNRAAQGIDLRPHGGESPRDVRARVAEWMARIAAAGRPTGAVTHQGVIRAALSLATGWNMVRKPPFDMNWESVHLFYVRADGTVEIARLNISLLPDEGTDE
jgi:probable phosphoglycerate mutase